MLGQDPNENRRNGCGGENDGENQNQEVRNEENAENLECENEDENELDESLKNDDDGSSRSSQTGFFDAARCSESMPSSDSNKENLDSNDNSENWVDFDPSDYLVGKSNFGEYDNTDQIPLPQLLKMHVKQLVSGFEFGEATKRRAQENMKTARDKKKNENGKSGEIQVSDLQKEDDSITDSAKPCCSKNLAEVEHKTPHSRKRQRLAESKVNTVTSERDFSSRTHRVPDCLLEHPDCIEVWVYMIYKEEASQKLRNPRLFNDFKSVTPRMRAILLDWLMEVAAVYHLRRVTYYLSVDYFDRFLSIRPDIPKSLLQLVGITCLYIAAKVEEIYPPNLSEFSYVCDGACQSKDMVSCELLILNSLGWEVVLTTPSDWLNLYMQLHFKSKDLVKTTLNMDFNKDFVFPQYSAYQFTRASQLMDLLSLDPGFLKFGYSVVAAAAMFYMYGKEIALSVSGLAWEQLKPCVEYMEVFNTIIEDSPDPRLHSCGGPPHEDINRFSAGLLKRVQTGAQNENYSFQTHVASMEYFEKATICRLTRYALHNSLQSTEKTDDQENPQTPVFDKSGATNGDAGNQENPETPVSGTTGATNDDDGNGNEENAVGHVEDSLVDDLNSLEVLTNSNENDNPDSEQNLMSIDEIFEFILSQDEIRNTNLE